MPSRSTTRNHKVLRKFVLTVNGIDSLKGLNSMTLCVYAAPAKKQ